MLELNNNAYPLKLPETLSDNAIEELEKALAAYLDYKEIILLNTVESAFF